MFKFYEKVSHENKVLAGNNNTAVVVEKETIELEFTSGKKLVLIMSCMFQKYERALFLLAFFVIKVSNVS